jgi:hypothetical protein
MTVAELHVTFQRVLGSDRRALEALLFCTALE